MHPNRRRKKRPNYGIRTVEVNRGSNGFGFTISGQQPCILSCIVNNSPADQAGLRAGDFLISVNGVSVSKITHDSVVNLIGNSVGPIKMTIAENYYSDSSDEELEVSRMINSRKPKYAHKPRNHRFQNKAERRLEHSVGASTSKSNVKPRPCALPHPFLNKSKISVNFNDSKNSSAMSMEDEAGPIEFKTFVGYVGTIEMPEQLSPSTRLHTVCSCIRKLRQEKRTPTAVLMTVLPTCLTLKNSSNHILAIYPTNRVVYIGSTTDKESRYFGLVTSAVCDNRNAELLRNNTPGSLETQKSNNADIDVSNSCHVFVTDPKLVEHNAHVKKAESFNITCTVDIITGKCLEFPNNALYIVNLVQNMYKLQGDVKNPRLEDHLMPVVANSPQPSASSNSDSGIGFRDDFGNVSDRILVVEFPARADVLNNVTPPNLNNVRSKNFVKPNDLSNNVEVKPLNNINNIRAYDNVNIRNILEKSSCSKSNNFSPEFVYNNFSTIDKLHCRAIPSPKRSASSSIISSDDNTHLVDSNTNELRTENANKKSLESLTILSNADDDNISMRSNNDLDKDKYVFKTPNADLFDRKVKQKLISSCDNLDRYDESILKYKLSPKVYGIPKPNYSCEELSNLDYYQQDNFGSLNEWYFSNGSSKSRWNIAQSEPDVRTPRNSMGVCDQNGNAKGGQQGCASWATSFEKLLEDPLGLHTFTEFLKKEFSAENIDFWMACESYRQIQSAQERVAEAQRIYRQHLCVGASEAVNVDAHGRQCAEMALPEASSNIFDLAQKQIFNLMKFDSYPRFLKSDLYKNCLANADKFAGGNSIKLKKSLSNAEDRRRKSLLPWHRKSRSKSKDRGEVDCAPKRADLSVKSMDTLSVKNGGSDIHSSRSSLTSLDQAISITSSQDNSKGYDDRNARTALCRVSLGNDSTTVVQIKESETIQQLVQRLLDKRGLSYSSFEVYTDKHSKAMNLLEKSAKLAGCEVKVQQRVVFKIDFPNRKTVSVKSKATKQVVEVLKPILHKYDYSLDHVVVLKENTMIDVNQSIINIDGAKLIVHLREDNNTSKQSTTGKAKLVEITNQVFESILQEKVETTVRKPKSDKGSVKSEDWGSEHSSSILGKFLRKDSSHQDSKKKSLIPRSKLLNSTHVNEDIGDNIQNRKPLIAKWKAGANKLQVSPCSESDELVEGLTRAQKSRLEDQRGTEINFELPDFLKDKEKERELFKSKQRTNSTSEASSPTYSGNKTISMKLDFSPGIATKNIKLDQAHAASNYENRSIIVEACAAKEQSKLGSLRIYSPNKFPITSSQASILESTPEEKPSESKKDRNEPPPLPPKPKIIPLKPSNWGQNGYYRPRELSSGSETLFLDQPSSSFV